MEILALSTPDDSCILPVENCINFCLYSPDYVINKCTNPRALFNLDVLNGTTAFGSFEFLGQTFTVDDSTSFTTNTFDWNADPEVANSNFYNMLASNYEIVSIAETSILNFFEAQLVGMFFKDCKEIDYGFDQSNLSPNIGNSLNTGTDKETIDGFKIGYRIFSKTLGCYISETQASEPKEDQNRNYTFCFDLQDFLSSYVKTSFPNSSTAERVSVDRSFKHEFCIRAFSITNQDCKTSYSSVSEIGPFTVGNFAIQPNDFEGYPCYNYIQIPFQTKRPNNFICVDQYEWIWICLDLNSRLQLPEGFSFTYAFCYLDLNTGATRENIYKGDNTYRVPSGSAQVDSDNYVVIVKAKIVSDDDPSSSIDLIVSSRQYTVINCGCCNNFLELYFLESCGGFSTIRFDCVESIDIVSTSSEICVETTCKNTYANYQNNLLNGGKRQIGHDNIEYINFIGYFDNTPEVVEWLKDFKGSTEMYGRIEDKQGEVQFQRFLIASNSLRISLDEGEIKVVGRGYYSINRNFQSQ